MQPRNIKLEGFLEKSTKNSFYDLADSASNPQCPGFEYDSYAFNMVGDGYEKVSSYELKLVLYILRCTRKWQVLHF
jgi:hypothetical protein